MIKHNLVVKTGLEPITHVCVALQADPVLHHIELLLFLGFDRGVYQFHHLTNLLLILIPFYFEANLLILKYEFHKGTGYKKLMCSSASSCASQPLMDCVYT